MAHFKYSALSRDGAKVSGIVEGYDELDAAARIKESCDVILKISQVSERRTNLLTAEIGGNRLNAKAFAVMCSQFAIILEAGLPISRTVSLVAEKTADKPLKRILKKVAVDVEGGRSVSAAFADQGKKMIPLTFLETLRAGEATGDLARSFRTMQQHFDKQTQTRGKVRRAMAYPMFVLVTAVIVVAVLMAKVVPKFTVMFAEMGGQLPAPTRVLIAISDFFQNYIWLVLGGIALIILGVKTYGSREEGRLKLAKRKLHLPILGRVEELNAASQFANTMAAMMTAGLTMDRAVSVTAKVVDNYYLSQQTDALGKQLQAGRTLGASMKDTTDYPDILVDMTSMGESSGEMEKTMRAIAVYYDAELDEAIQSALGKLEPALLIGIAAIAGFIVIAVYLAIFSLYGSMGAA